MNRRDAFRTAAAAAIAAMFPRVPSVVDDIAKAFGVPAKTLGPLPACCIYADTTEFRRSLDEVSRRLALAMAEKIDRDWGAT